VKRGPQRRWIAVVSLLAQYRTASFLPIEKTQAGGVGQTVFSGIYVGERFSMGLVKGNAPRAPGWSLHSLAYEFWVSTENFHGAVNSWNLAGRILYVP
jgi:hypothetical protein